jgi:hypothetical protein
VIDIVECFINLETKRKAIIDIVNTLIQPFNVAIESLLFALKIDLGGKWRMHIFLNDTKMYMY